MPNDLTGKCPLCFRQILVKNFKRHCERQHSSINTEEKYKKQLLKLKESIINNENDHPSKSKTVERPHQLNQQSENEQLLLSSSTEHHREQSSTGGSDVCSITDAGTSTCSTINETVQLTSITEPAQLTSIINESVQLSSIINEPAQLTSIINEPAQLTSIINGTVQLTSINEPAQITSIINESFHLSSINEPAQLTSIVNEPIQSSSIVDEPVQLSSINIENNDQMVEIKNKICGGVKYLIERTNQCSNLVELSVDPDLSDKFFIIQIVSYLKLIQGSVTDLINECNYALQKIPTLETNIHEIQLSEITTSRDPSFKKDFNEKELRYLINEGPYQPLLTKFADNEFLKKKNDTCHFVKKWYQEYPLIEYSPITNAAYCFSCRLFGDGPGNGQQEDAWSTVGVTQWDKMKGSRGKNKAGKLETHFKSDSHLSSLKRYLNFKNRRHNVDYMLDANIQQHEQSKIQVAKSNQDVVKILINCTRYLSRQDLAFRGNKEEDGNYIQLVHLMSKYNPLIQHWLADKANRPYQVTYMSKDSQNEFINLIGEAVLDKSLSEARKARYYSLMADSTPDSNRQEMFSVFIRYVDENLIPKERLISIKEPIAKTGDALSNHILGVINETGLDPNCLISQSYDCAKNMSGCFQGVQAHMTKKLGREIIYVPCTAHRSNTALKIACEASLDVKCVVDILQTIYNYFTCSTKRYNVLKEKYASNSFALIPKTTSTTRWNSKYESFKAIYESYGEILEALDHITNDDEHFDSDTRTESRSITRNMKSFNFITYLVFVKNLMSTTNALTCDFQEEKLDLVTATETLQKTIILLQSERNDNDNLNRILDISESMATKFNINPDQEFNIKHRKRRPPRRIDENPQTTYDFSRRDYYVQNFRNILDYLIVQYHDMVKSMNDNLKCIGKLSPKYILNLSQDDAIVINEMMSGNDSQLLFKEIKLFAVDINEQCDTISKAAQFIVERKEVVPRLYQAYIFLLTLPVTVASNERGFSKLKIIKNRLRSRIGDDRLQSLLLCSIETDLLDELTDEELIERWLKNKCGRRI